MASLPFDTTGTAMLGKSSPGIFCLRPECARSIQLHVVVSEVKGAKGGLMSEGFFSVRKAAFAEAALNSNVKLNDSNIDEMNL